MGGLPLNNVVLKNITKILFPFIVIYGIYIIFHGHLSPGGGFAGGTIIGAAFILKALAFEQAKNVKILPYTLIKKTESISMLYYVVLGLTGVFASHAFLSNTKADILLGHPGNLLSGGLILFINLGIGIKVAATIISVFSSLEEGGM